MNQTQRLGAWILLSNWILTYARQLLMMLIMMLDAANNRALTDNFDTGCVDADQLKLIIAMLIMLKLIIAMLGVSMLFMLILARKFNGERWLTLLWAASIGAIHILCFVLLSYSGELLWCLLSLVRKHMVGFHWKVHQVFHNLGQTYLLNIAQHFLLTWGFYFYKEFISLQK